jgi:phage N-6-adenine-methyltransferase
MFSSKTDLWSTPQELFDRLNNEFGFTLDVCALPENTKCATYFTPDRNGLAQDWRGVCWMNPPYGRGIGAWVQKAHFESMLGATVVCLLPARTDTQWWHRYVIPYAAEIRFIKGRIKFSGCPHNAPFPSAVVVFRPQTQQKVA